MKKVILLFPALMLLVGNSCRNESGSSNQAVDALFEKYHNTSGPGCALAVIENDKVVYKQGYGMANLEYDIPLTTSTVFDIASVSKQFAGLAISTLVQEGKISLDDDIRKYLPDVPDFGKRITIRHLVSHTSGLRDWPQTLNVAGWRWDDVFSFDDILRMVKNQKDLDFEPGARMSYSNTGYNMLAAIVAKVSGKSFTQWTDENIFTPLHMDASHFLSDPGKIIKNMAYSYDGSDKNFVKRNTSLTAYGSSSLFTNVDDLILWVIYFNQQVAAKNPIYLRMLEEGVLNDGNKTGYAFGLGLDVEGTLKTVSHNGGWAGYRTAIINFPDEKISVIVLGNASDFDAAGKSLEVAKIFLKGKFKEEKNKGATVKDEPTVKLNTTFAKKCTGTYRLDDGWYLTITLENDTVRTRATGESRFSMIPKSDSVFWIDGYNASLTFIVDEKGEVSSLRYKWIESAKRVSPITIDPKVFVEYAGIYHSEELATEYKVDVLGGKLMMHHMRLGDIELEPDVVTRDLFTSRVGTIQFVMNDHKKPTGFRVSGGRVKNLWFERR